MVNKLKPLIMIVEDELLLNEAYELILKKHDYEVVSVFNGQQALEAIKQKTPDLILLDLRMPKMGGLEFLKQADLPKTAPKVKVIVFSNYDVQRDIDESFEYGATRYMLKAWASPKELLKLVKETLEGKN